MTMELSVTEAATLLRRPARTLRGQLRRGEIRGVKRGGRWRIPRHALPMTEEQREALLLRADEARRVVDAALPSRLDGRRGREMKALVDLDVFRVGRELLFAMRRDPDEKDDEVVDALEDALCALARGRYAYEAGQKVGLLRDARDRFSTCLARLVLSADPLVDPCAAWAIRIERELLPSLSGLLRWAEGLSGRRSRT